MACWTVQTMSVEFKIGNADFLKKAIANLGWAIVTQFDEIIAVSNIRGTFVINLNKGMVNISTSMQSNLNKLKQEYSKVIIEEVARKKRWALKKMANNQYEMRRYN
jgi:hypothetical protein